MRAIYPNTQRETKGDKNMYDIYDRVVLALLFKFQRNTLDKR